MPVLSYSSSCFSICYRSLHRPLTSLSQASHSPAVTGHNQATVRGIADDQLAHAYLPYFIFDAAQLHALTVSLVKQPAHAIFWKLASSSVTCPSLLGAGRMSTSQSHSRSVIGLGRWQSSLLTFSISVGTLGTIIDDPSPQSDNNPSAA